MVWNNRQQIRKQIGSSALDQDICIRDSTLKTIEGIIKVTYEFSEEELRNIYLCFIICLLIRRVNNFHVIPLWHYRDEYPDN